MTTESTVKEKPILMSGAMVRAILDGRKSQTRRIVKPQPVPHDFGEGGIKDAFVQPQTSPGFVAVGATVIKPGDTAYVKLPYGQPGDRLWVKETWQEIPDGGGTIVYRATDPDWESTDEWKWRPSIFMKREYSRITLEITGVRVERLNEISEQDTMAEGLYRHTMKASNGESFHYSHLTPRELFEHSDVPCGTTARIGYKILWESINGPDSWSLNPYVWVISFRRITP